MVARIKSLEWLLWSSILLSTLSTFYVRLKSMMFPNWAKNILFLLVYMISGLVLVIIIEGLTSGTELMPLNLVIERAMVHLRTPIMTTLLVAVTKLGNPFI